MAGLGEACMHIATLLFAIDATVKILDSKTVTQEPAYWLLPAARREINYREIGHIDFTSAQTKRKNLEDTIASGLEPSPLAASPRVREPRKVVPPSDAELETFFTDSAWVTQSLPCYRSCHHRVMDLFLSRRKMFFRRASGLVASIRSDVH